MTLSFNALFRAILLVVSLMMPLSLVAPAAMSAEGAADIAAPGVDPAKIDGLVKTLEDPEARDQLIEQLKALNAVQDPEDSLQSVEELGLGLVELLTQRVNTVAVATAELFTAIVDLPDLVDWLTEQATNPNLRSYWIDLFIKLAVVLGGSVIGHRIARYFMNPTINRFYDERPDDLVTIVPLALLRGALRLIPVLAFAAIGYGLLTLLGDWNGDATTILGRSLVDATLFCLVLVVGARTALAPSASGLRLIKLDDGQARYIFHWIKRFIYLIAYSYVIAHNELVLKIPSSIYGGLERGLGLVVVLMLIFLVLKNRKRVAQWLRGSDHADNDHVMRVLGRCRRLVADIWPVFAIFYIVSTYLIWALAIPGGFSLLLRGGVLTTMLLVIARPLAYGVERALGKGLSLGTELRRRYPAFERRINRYLGLLQGFAVSVVYFLILLTLVQVWGFNLFTLIGGWFSDETWSRLTTAATVIGVSFVISEVISVLIENYLDAVDDSGTRIERSARTRTLLPLLRTFLFLLIGVVVILTTLSTLGIDVTPVLAAAGVIGIAIGFGSQKLVQDIINGLFILFQDTIAVGEVVDVAGHSGTVEHISVRTIGLRDLSGRAHTIPFSEVTTITNHTKDFAFAELDIGIGYREDVDEVIEAIRQIGAELETDPVHGQNMMEPIQVLGVDQFADSAVVIKARIKTRPMTQWAVRRGFNRLMKYRFDELGIEIPYPHQTVYFGEDKEGRAPPAHVLVDRGARDDDQASEKDKDAAGKPKSAPSIRIVNDGTQAISDGTQEEAGHE
ncbi:MAG: mechanosensitive ion channel [Alphaproteobacteria bacterium]|nr:mechanosensitive ion channel [Alphaproteobacteria bacterium]